MRSSTWLGRAAWITALLGALSLAACLSPAGSGDGGNTTAASGGATASPTGTPTGQGSTGSGSTGSRSTSTGSGATTGHPGSGTGTGSTGRSGGNPTASTGQAATGGTTAAGTTGGTDACGNACGSGQTCIGGHCQTIQACPNDGGPCALGSGFGYCCGSTCTDTTTDPGNCGQCGVPCPGGEACTGGVCFDADAGVEGCSPSIPCPTGYSCAANGSLGLCLSPSCAGAGDDIQCAAANGTVGLCCGRACVPVNTDANHCGLCNITCPAGDLCNDGSCAQPVVCSDAGSAFGACYIDSQDNGVCCGATCTDTQTDPANCSFCGGACNAGEICAGGSCLFADCSISGAEGEGCIIGPGSHGICCESSCVDIATDPNNCSFCGNVCVAGQICSGNYGCLSTACPAVGPSRFQGIDCVTPSGKLTGSCCGSQCISLDDQQSDLAHCGGCNACPPNPTFTCQNGACTAADCASVDANTSCNTSGVSGRCCGGACESVAQLISDPNNCSACGANCPAGLQCDGVCSYDGGFVGCDEGGCLAGEACIGDSVCVTTTCAGATDGVWCSTSPGVSSGGPSACCGGECVNPASDSDNCGYCGNACPAQTACAGGACVSGSCSATSLGTFCVAGSSAGSCCGADCAELGSDPQNCGGCGRICPVGWPCEDGQCVNDAGPSFCLFGATCPPGTGCASEDCASEDCTGQLDTMPCYNGVFGGGACCGQICVDTQTDPANCGGCGVSCGTAACSSGSCL